MKTAKLTLLIVLTVLAIVFVIQNLAVVEIEFLMWSISMSRALMLLIVLVIGITIGWLLTALRRRHR